DVVPCGALHDLPAPARGRAPHHHAAPGRTAPALPRLEQGGVALRPPGPPASLSIPRAPPRARGGRGPRALALPARAAMAGGRGRHGARGPAPGGRAAKGARAGRVSRAFGPLSHRLQNGLVRAPCIVSVTAGTSRSWLKYHQ